MTRSATSDIYERQRSPEAREKREQIFAERAACKERGERYPSITVEDLKGPNVLWIGRVPYDWETLAVLKQAVRRENREPVALPDDFILDGEVRLPGESDRFYKWYCAYRDLGIDRTYVQMARSLDLPTDTKTNNYAQIAKKWHWRDRAELWDADIRDRMQRALETKIAADVDEHADKRKGYLEREDKLMDMLLTRLEEMAHMPVIDKIIEHKDGKTITHIHAVNWSYGDIAKLVKEVGSLARLNHGLPTSNAAIKMDQSVTGSLAVNTNQQQDFGNMSPAERAAHEYAARVSEDAYFAALAEYKARQTGVPQVVDSIASEAADG